MMSPAFLSPRERFRGAVMLERKDMKEMESEAVRERPFLFCWLGRVSGVSFVLFSLLPKYV